jgi:glycosyltransferase involved in cell wall biosynthesis
LPYFLKIIFTQWDHFKYGYPDVFRIDPKGWMAYDGHHRLACLYEAGERFVKAKVVGVIKAQPQDFEREFGFKPLLSVIVPTYNRADVLSDILHDLLRQQTNEEFDYEVIVADNNSNDNTKSIVESFQGRFEGRLHYVFEPKQARAHALNAGLKMAQGEIICCVDDDCVLAENYLWNLHKVFNQVAPDVGMIGGKILPKWIGGETPAWLQSLFSQPARYADGTFNRIKIGFEGVLGIMDYGDEPFLINEARKIKSSIQFFGANFAFRKKVLEQYGKFSAVNRIGEDTEMFERLINAGVKGVYAPTVCLQHKIPIEKGTPQFFYHWWYMQGIHMDLRQKYDRRFYFPFGVPSELLGKTMEFVQKCVSEKDPILKVHWRTYVHYHLGQIANVFNRNVMKRAV